MRADPLLVRLSLARLRLVKASATGSSHGIELVFPEEPAKRID